jgi:hypothetical protein
MAKMITVKYKISCNFQLYLPKRVLINSKITHNPDQWLAFNTVQLTGAFSSCTARAIQKK